MNTESKMHGASSAWSSLSDREQAKRIIHEIVRCASGTMQSRTRLFKAFYFAHLFYTQEAPDHLSHWRIVRMPFGPGIDDADALLCELRDEGLIEMRPVMIGPYSSVEYKALGKVDETMPLDGISAIRKAVEFVSKHSAAEISELTHEHSQTWKRTANGGELNIYLDLLTDVEYDATQRRMDQHKRDLEAAALL